MAGLDERSRHRLDRLEELHDHSTPCLGGRRLPYYEPTPIEISADALESFFRITPKIRKPSAKITAKMLTDLVGDYLAAEKKPTKTGCRAAWKALHGSWARKKLDDEYDRQAKVRNKSQKSGPRP
jgi:hypothetical protein